MGGGFAGSFMALLISHLFAGLFAANISTASAYMADITPPEERAKGMGLVGAAYGLGFIFGPAVGGFLFTFGPNWPCFFAALLTGGNFIWAFFVLGEPLTDRQLRSENRRRLSFKLFKEVLLKPLVAIPILLYFLVIFAFVQLEITFVLYVFDRFQSSEKTAGYLLAFMGVVVALIQGGAIGRLTKRFGESKLITLGLFLLAAGFGTMAIAGDLMGLITSLIILGIGYSLTNPCLLALTSKSAPKELQGSVLGVYHSGGSAARVLAPLIAGALYDRAIHYPYLLGIGVIFLAGLVWAPRMMGSNPEVTV